MQARSAYLAPHDFPNSVNHRLRLFDVDVVSAFLRYLQPPRSRYRGGSAASTARPPRPCLPDRRSTSFGSGSPSVRDDPHRDIAQRPSNLTDWPDVRHVPFTGRRRGRARGVKQTDPTPGRGDGRTRCTRRVRRRPGLRRGGRSPPAPYQYRQRLPMT